MSDGSLGSLHRWRSQRIAKCQSCELQDTLAHLWAADHLTYWTNKSLCSCSFSNTTVRLVECSLHNISDFVLYIYFIYVYNYFESFYYTFLRVKYVILYINLLSNIFFYICKVYFYKILYLYINFYYIIFIIYLKNR